jgi:hypothetical protein
LQVLGVHCWDILVSFAVLERSGSRLLGFSQLGIGQVCDYITTEGWPAPEGSDIDCVKFLTQRMIEASIQQVEIYQKQTRLSLDQMLLVVADYFYPDLSQFAEVAMGAILQRGDFWSVMNDCLLAQVEVHYGNEEQTWLSGETLCQHLQQEENLSSVSVEGYRKRLCEQLFGRALMDDLEGARDYNVIATELSVA